jgi:hypothetical protein
MNGTAQGKAGWREIVPAVIAISAVLAGVLTYLIFAMPSADPPEARPGAVRLFATWLMFTVLLSLMFAAGIWRMTGGNTGAESDISPRGALIAMAATVAVCGLGAFAYFVFRQGG